MEDNRQAWILIKLYPDHDPGGKARWKMEARTFRPAREDTICIEDFCGYTSPGHFFTQFWADWSKSEEMLFFGGDWDKIPPMPAVKEPTADDAYTWALGHGYNE